MGSLPDGHAPSEVKRGCVIRESACSHVRINECTSGEREDYPRDMNLNLNIFWTLVVVLIGAPLLASVLVWGSFAVALLLGYNPDF
jgi:hypothetical protein